MGDNPSTVLKQSIILEYQNIAMIRKKTYKLISKFQVKDILKNKKLQCAQDEDKRNPVQRGVDYSLVKKNSV